MFPLSILESVTVIGACVKSEVTKALVKNGNRVDKNNCRKNARKRPKTPDNPEEGSGNGYQTVEIGAQTLSHLRLAD